MTCGKRTKTNRRARPRTSSSSQPRVISLLTLLGAGAEYKIESKMTLTQASLENTQKIIKQKELEKGSSTHSNRLLDDDRSNTKLSGAVNPGVADIIFEGTFKPQTMHLNQPANYSGNVDEAGMPFGTFGGGYRLEEGSGAAYPNRDQTSFYNASSDKQREISVKTLQ